MRSALFASLFLASCTTVPVAIPPKPLAAVPDDLRVCFERITDLPATKIWSAEVSGETITKLRKSELGKTDCGKRLLKFYDDQREQRP